QPYFEQVNVSGGQPGDAVLITGSNFTSSTKVFFQLPQQNGWQPSPMESQIDYLAERQILCTVPDFVGVDDDVTGSLWLQDGGLRSNLIFPFRFKPALDIVPMTIRWLAFPGHQTLDTLRVEPDAEDWVYRVEHKVVDIPHRQSEDLFFNPVSLR